MGCLPYINFRFSVNPHVISLFICICCVDEKSMDLDQMASSEAS